MRALLAFILALCLTLPASAQGSGQERITSFDSAITVQKDGSIEVTETIAVDVLNIAIKRGIFRDIPTRYKDAHGGAVNIGLDVLDVKRDGRSEPYRIENLANGIRIRIGSASATVPQGRAVYTIRYRATRELGFFDKYDELYWNVTGNGWDFPIDKASIKVTLPAGASILQSQIYTGSQGETGKNATVTQGQGTTFAAQTTAPLLPRQGFTIAVGWPKGFVTPPATMPPASAQSSGQERITSFDSAVTVQKNGSIEVTETIAVDVLNIAIKRGIFRDIPTRYKDAHGGAVNVGLDVLEVKRDGRSEPYQIEDLANGVRIRIGNADATVPRGRAVYAIRYRATRELGFFDKYDELYWNVTGNGWDFPINKASIKVTLPAGASILRVQFYTGYQGETGRNAIITQGKEAIFAAQTIAPLQPRQGFTIAVGWPKGFVTPPGTMQKLVWFGQDNPALALAMLGFMTIGGYYFWAWRKVGRDPAPGVIVPVFHPPEGITPAAARYIQREGFDDKTFSSAIISLAVKGRLKIADTESSFTIQPQVNPPPASLGKEEAELMSTLANQDLEVTQANQTRVAAARDAVSNALAKLYKGRMFNLHRPWFAAGLALSILVGLAIKATNRSATFDPATIMIWIGAMSLIFWSGFSRIRNSRLVTTVSYAGGLAVLAVQFFSQRLSTADLLLLGLIIAIAGLNLVFFFLLPAPTQEGRGLLDKIEGFRLYLATAEEARLNILNPPERTPDLFERYLPYALAVDCSHEWSNKFTAVLAAASIAAPAWYAGSNWNSSSPSGFVSSIGDGLASSISSAATPPGSGSGGGGGFSGGGGSSGGGGGGGGGW